jgi:hypothetical protein
MTDMTKDWLVEMLDREIKEVNGTISNHKLWAHADAVSGDGWVPESSLDSHIQTVLDLTEYKSLLLKIKEQIVVEGMIRV